jgi:hypothetical protein
MAQADYIPAGRTSRIRRGKIDLTLQTEYAVRPNPRLTTSVFSEGQVIYKIEKELAGPVTSLEDKSRVEILLRRQHVQAMDVVNSDSFPPIESRIMNPSASTRETTVEKIDQNELSLADRIRDVEGVTYVIELDNDGNFTSTTLSEKFKKQFDMIFRNLHEILDIFTAVPGGSREQGVYEVERNRLYLISAGKVCYFVLVRSGDTTTDFESIFQRILHDFI